MFRDATFNSFQTHRFSLVRRWGPGTLLVFVMLNPSTADGTEDDPTIRRCIGFARDNGHDALIVVNVFTIRATDPADLVPVVAGGGWTDNHRKVRDLYIADAVGRSPVPPVAAWGAHPVAKRERARVLGLAPTWSHLGLTKGGEPRHPLYLPKATPLTAWTPEGVADV